MLRISTLPNRSYVTVKLEGKLLGPWLAEFDRACADAATAGLPVRLDLSDLLYLDGASVKHVRQVLSRGDFAIAGCSHFVAELLHQEVR